jgi:hypothetical protein
MNDEEIKQCIARAFERLLGEQPSLDFHHVHERSTSHRLAVQMEPEFPGWNIDCEYDRSEQMRKLLDGIRDCDPERATDRIFPDIIVHHRGVNGPQHNLLVVELKKDAREDRCDFQKLCGLTDPGRPFGYQLGLYININHGQFDCTWFKDGRAIPRL